MTEMITFEQMLPAKNQWELMLHQSAELIKSGFLPAAIKTPEQACLVMLKGRELGIPSIQALSHIHIIGGKCCMSAELMLSQILRLHPRTRISYPVRTNERCEIEVQRDGCKLSTFVFTIADAKQAGLMGNQTWTKYPRAMLHARCVSEMARSLFADAISGVSYTPEEIGANVNEHGEIIDVNPTTKEITTTTTDDMPMEKQASAAIPYAPAAAAFSRGDATQIRILGNFLGTKNKMNLFDAMADALTGKAFTQTLLASTFLALEGGN